jgi:hypothetical protein
MKIEFIPHGTCPEFSFVVDLPDGSRKVGILADVSKLKILKDALKDVV